MWRWNRNSTRYAARTARRVAMTATAAAFVMSTSWGTAAAGPHVCNGPPEDQLPESVREAIARPDPGTEGGRDAWAPLLARTVENRKAVERGEMDAGEAALLGGTGIFGSRDFPVFPFLFANTAGAPYTRAKLEDELFTGPWPTGTMKQYYQEVSYGGFSVGGHVDPWFTLSHNDSYYAGSSYGLNPANAHLGDGLREILAARDAAIDFSQWDNDGPDGDPNSGDDDGYVDFIAFVTPDKGAECPATTCPWTSDGGTLWSHQWYLSQYGGTYTTDDPRSGGGFIRVNRYFVSAGLGCDDAQNGIGTFCHEFGHALGLADYYDTYDGNGESEGIGHWGLMGSGGWNTQTHPSHMTAWCKERLGWLHFFNVNQDLSSLCFPPVEEQPFAARLWTHGAESQQYFLVENRQAIGFDQDLHGPGLIIYHVDETRSNNNDETHKLIDVECADAVSAGHVANADDLDMGRCHGGNRGDAGDPWCPATQATFDDTSVPNSRSYLGAPTEVAVRNIPSCTGDAEGTICAQVEVGTPLEANLCMHDCDGDGCAEVTDCGTWWATPDLWIDNDNDGDDDIPSENVKNVLWYRVKNAGPSPIAGASIQLFYQDPGLGLRWPDTGVLIKEETLDDVIQPGDTYIDSVVFVYPDAPEYVDHYCLGAVVTHDLDPQNSQYPPHDNNVVQVNHQVLVSRGEGGRAPVGPGQLLATSCGSFARTSRIRIHWGDTFYGRQVEVRLGSPPDFDDASIPAGWNLEFDAGPYMLEPGAIDSVDVKMSATDAMQGETAHVPITLWDVFAQEPAGGAVLDYVVDCAAPLPPGGVTGECLPYSIDQIGGPSVLIEWDPVTLDVDGGAEKIKHYLVYRSDDDGHPETLIEATAIDADFDRPGFQWYDTVPKSDIVYTYRLQAVDNAETVSDFSAPAVIDFVACDAATGVGMEAPAATRLYLESGNPNPFTAATAIAFRLPQAEEVTLRVYDARGRLVTTLLEGRMEAGSHRVDWSGRDHGGRSVNPGIYFVRLAAGRRVETEKLVRLEGR